MARFILVTFAFLGWAFYELSGGAAFEPASARLADMRTDPLKPTPAAQQSSASAVETTVTRVSLNLTSVEDVLSGGTTQPASIVAPLPQVSPAYADDPEPVDFPTSQGTDVAAIIPSLVEGAETTTVVQIASLADAPIAPTDIRSVSGTSVNVRGGPGTSYGVVSRLGRGDEVEVLEDEGTGWVQIRPLDGGPIGWIADFLLSEG